jgi:hypothetical protein
MSKDLFFLEVKILFYYDRQTNYSFIIRPSLDFHASFTLFLFHHVSFRYINNTLQEEHGSINHLENDQIFSDKNLSIFRRMYAII